MAHNYTHKDVDQEKAFKIKSFLQIMGQVKQYFPKREVKRFPGMGETETQMEWTGEAKKNPALVEELGRQLTFLEKSIQ